MGHIIFALAFSVATVAQAETLTIGTLNTESGSDTQPFKVAETIRGIGPVDVWAFQEVANIEAAVEFTVAAGAASNRKRYRYVISESGEISAPRRRNDFLAIAYNSSRFRQVETVELHGIRSKPGPGRGARGDRDSLAVGAAGVNRWPLGSGCWRSPDPRARVFVWRALAHRRRFPPLFRGNLTAAAPEVYPLQNRKIPGKVK